MNRNQEISAAYQIDSPIQKKVRRCLDFSLSDVQNSTNSLELKTRKFVTLHWKWLLLKKPLIARQPSNNWTKNSLQEDFIYTTIKGLQQ